MSSARTGSWEAAHPRLAGFLGLLERLVARVPTGGRAAMPTPTTGPPLVGPEPLPLGIIEGAAGERVVVGLPLDAVPAGPAALGPPRHGKGATT